MVVLHALPPRRVTADEIYEKSTMGCQCVDFCYIFCLLERGQQKYEQIGPKTDRDVRSDSEPQLLAIGTSRAGHFRAFGF